MERVDPPADVLSMLRRAVRDRTASHADAAAGETAASRRGRSSSAEPVDAPPGAAAARDTAGQSPDGGPEPTAPTRASAHHHLPSPAAAYGGEAESEPEPSAAPEVAPRPSPSQAAMPRAGASTRSTQPSLFDAIPAVPNGRFPPRGMKAPVTPDPAGTPAPPDTASRRDGAEGAGMTTPALSASPRQPPPRAAASAAVPAPSGDALRRQTSPDLAEGHRERLRARFDRGESLPDYEFLELLLFRSLPRVDTKPIAKALIREFGSFAAAIAAPAHRLTAIPGLGGRAASDFRLVRAAAERLTHGELAERKTLTSTDAVVDFFRARLRTADREEFHLLFLDKKNQFLAAERAAVGTVDHTPVCPREVMRRALELSATAIVLVHNHPSGDPTPSRADVEMTRKIIEAGAPLGVAVHDHLIVGANRCLSLRAEGLL